ncbi:hypothetical protein GCM10022237_48640 [Nocardioides ginsengisoli]|uniref:Uncharacterized protein n=1 Tax=Nocardioides ginsengisoli TaxID=363868 RepID=A0ABW3W1Y9_9ACTN
MPRLIFNGLICFAASAGLFVVAVILSYTGGSALVQASSMIAIAALLAFVAALCMLTIAILRLVRESRQAAKARTTARS